MSNDNTRMYVFAYHNCGLMNASALYNAENSFGFIAFGHITGMESDAACSRNETLANQRELSAHPLNWLN